MCRALPNYFILLPDVFVLWAVFCVPIFAGKFFIRKINANFT